MCSNIRFILGIPLMKHSLIKSIFFSLLFISSQSFAGTLTDFEQQLAQYKGKVVYLDFWASWCVPCRKSFPWMNEMQKKHGVDDFTVLSVNLDAQPALAAKFLLENPANFPIFYDAKGKVAKAFKLKGMPSSYIINKSGKIVSAHVGFTDKKKTEYQAEIIELLAK
jgi:thiol-disulfide isomerase/thioredoxin